MSDHTHEDGRYTCEQAFARLYEYLDRDLRPQEEALVAQHLAICEECTRHFGFEKQLLATIRERCRIGRAPESLRRRIAKLIESL